MTTGDGPGALVELAADYRHAVRRLEDAASAADLAWRQLPSALDSPGTELAAGRYVAPARQLATALVHAADSLHAALLAWQHPARAADAQPGGPAGAAGSTALELSCATAIFAIRGGEADSAALPTPASPAGVATPASLVVPVAPPAIGASGLGGALVDGAAAAETLAASGLLGLLGLVLSMGGSSDTTAGRGDHRKPRNGIDEVRVTPYTPCNPWDHGPGCQERHLGVEKPGDEPFTGAKVRGDEPPGQMPGTRSDWTMGPTRKGDGVIYTSPDGREMRVMKPDADPRYPNGYVGFSNARGQRIDLDWHAHLPNTSDEVHITRNPDGSFPIPKGWGQ
jgi:hypothetical protein